MYTSSHHIAQYNVSPADQQAMFRIAHWITRNRRSVKKIRELAGSEECYMLIIREIDRVKSQMAKAHTFHLEATLTLLEWLEALEYFHWKCAYCEVTPFQVMSHIVPYPHGGTTVDNCLPACYSCIRQNRTVNERLAAYLARVKKVQ